jgi:hypothetical protein
MSDDLSTALPRIRPVRDPKEISHLVEIAAADHHRVLGATHLVEHHGEVLGYVSLGGMPTVHIWLHSQKIGPRESVRILGTIESMAADRRWPASVWCCAQSSPFSTVMPRLGFERLGDTTLHLKGH